MGGEFWLILEFVGVELSRFLRKADDDDWSDEEFPTSLSVVHFPSPRFRPANPLRQVARCEPRND